MNHPAGTTRDLRLHPLFSDHLVLQAGKPAPVWGWASPGRSVGVSFAGQRKQATADAEGRWSVYLEPLPVEATPRELVIQGDEEVIVRDVLVGEVWLASGQSNMWWPVRRSRDAEAEIAAAEHPLIRSFQVPWVAANQPLTSIDSSWQVCSPATVGDWSGVATYFARFLQQELAVPIGIVHGSVRGTMIETWLSRDAIATVPEATDIPDAWQQKMAEWEDETYPDPEHEIQAYFRQIYADLARYMSEVERLREAGHEDPLAVIEPRWLALRDQAKAIDRLVKHGLPSAFFNGMIAPLQPLAVRGLLWYQGESNAPKWPAYSVLLQALVNDWRRGFKQEDLHALIVGLANHEPGKVEPAVWAHIRDAQYRLQHQLPRVGFANIIDLGEAHNVHPPNKQDVGRRLGGLALRQVYGRERLVTGPEFAGLQRTEGRVRLRFDSVGEGLRTSDGAPPAAFQIAAEDGLWRDIDATIDSPDSVLLAVPDEACSLAVRYAWANNPSVNLINSIGLPAVPFCCQAQGDT